MAVVTLRHLLAALIPQRNVPARWDGCIHGKGTEGLQQRVLGSALQPHEWKITLLGASSMGWVLQHARPSQHTCPVCRQCVCIHGVSWCEQIPADTACAPAELHVCTTLRVRLCMSWVRTYARTQAYWCMCAVCWQARLRLPVGVHALRARARPRCAGTPGLLPRGAGVPSTIRSLGMLKLASCRRLRSVPAGRREGVGSRLAEFVLIITQVVTKSGMS